MTKFVLMDKTGRFQLNDEHVEWLRSNGYPDADRFFCEEDRTNPVLIQCIEAVRAAKQPFIDEANVLYQDYSKKASAVTTHQANYLLKQDEFVKSFNKVCNPRWKQGKTVVIALRTAIWNDCPWEKFCKEKIFEGISASDLQCLMPLYNDVYQVFLTSKPDTEISNTAREKLHAHCEAHGLRMYFGNFTIKDGFKINSYDESRFTATVVVKDNSATNYDNPTYWEVMQLTPFITRDTIDSFVAKGDTDGMMEYLRSLHLNLNIEG